MNHSGDAAEQIVRLSLEGVEVAAKITGTAAKEVALLLIAALKNQKGSLKTKGKARLTSMLKSGKPLEIFSVRERDLKRFMQGAKQYGIVYCVLRDKKNGRDGLCDIMVKADDAPKISRLVERFHFATVDRAAIENEIVTERNARADKARAWNTPGAGARDGDERDVPEINDIGELLDSLLGTDEGRTAPDTPEAPGAPGPSTRTTRAQARTEQERPYNRPLADSPPPSRPSAPTYANESRPEKTSSMIRPSVKAELREIKAARKKEEEPAGRDGRQKAERPDDTRGNIHRQPRRGRDNYGKSRLNR